MVWLIRSISKFLMLVMLAAFCAGAYVSYMFFSPKPVKSKPSVRSESNYQATLPVVRTAFNLFDPLFCRLAYEDNGVHICSIKPLTSFQVHDLSTRYYKAIVLFQSFQRSNYPKTGFAYPTDIPKIYIIAAQDMNSETIWSNVDRRSPALSRYLPDPCAIFLSDHGLKTHETDYEHEISHHLYNYLPSPKYAQDEEMAQNFELYLSRKLR